MIQLASRADTAADGLGFRPAANDGKANPFELRRRAGHAWPFISKAPEGASRETTNNAHNDSGS